MMRFACLAALLVASAAAAQSYPNRAVKVIVPWTPGQATDIAARVVAQKLQDAFGQAFVIDNKPGAGGAIGSDAVAKSAPDGYTLLAASSGPLSIMPNLQKVPYDPKKDFSPVSLIALTPTSTRSPPPARALRRISSSSSSTRWRRSRRATCPTREARPRSPT